MCSEYISILSHRLKGKWSLRRRQGFHSTLTVSFILRRHSASLSNWYNLSLIFTCTNGGENKWGSQKSLFLAINAKGGEILSPKQKDRTNNFKIFRNDDLIVFSQKIVFPIGIL
jgi:hypothetical protein